MASALGGELHGGDANFTGVSTDSRTIAAGELFVALHGPNFDGHAFVRQAGERQAAGALVDRAVDVDLPWVEVDDTRLGLGGLAAYWRSRFDCPLIAVTGSNGKTTVKEMIGSILRRSGPVLVSAGNLNNDVGLPLVLCRLRPEHACAVVEMGMNHRGEIDYLTRLARPRVAVITNVGPAHLEGLGSVQAVAEAKGEIFNGLESGGTAVINVDDEYASGWLSRTRGFRRVTFGIDNPADVSAVDLQERGGTTAMTLRTPVDACRLELPLPGRHNVMNALAAAAAALAVGTDLEHIRAGLESVTPVSGRLQHRTGAQGAVVIDDTYNANPSSMKAAIQVLAAARGNRIMVIGDMKELGTDALQLHAHVGREARAAGVDRLFTLGPLSRAAADEFGAGAVRFEDKNALIEALLSSLDADTTVLVKGSRGMRMEDVVDAITGNGVRH